MHSASRRTLVPSLQKICEGSEFHLPAGDHFSNAVPKINTMYEEAINVFAARLNEKKLGTSVIGMQRKKKAISGHPRSFICLFAFKVGS